jgi:hypothetical protein
MARTVLLLAALLEVGWAIGLKYTHGLTRFWPSVWTGLALRRNARMSRVRRNRVSGRRRREKNAWGKSSACAVF